MNYVKLFQSVSDSIRSEFYPSHSCTYCTWATLRSLLSIFAICLSVSSPRAQRWLYIVGSDKFRAKPNLSHQRGK